VTLTFSKAFASLGGALLGSERVVDYVRHHASPQIFSASMPPASVAAALTALRIARDEPWRAARVVDHGRYMAARLTDLGLDTAGAGTPIVPVRLGTVAETALTWRALLDRDVYVNAVFPPAATPRLRTSYTAEHTRAHLDQVTAAFADLHLPAA
jgi:8-amino-7-oxononanoate synthase